MNNEEICSKQISYDSFFSDVIENTNVFTFDPDNSKSQKNKFLKDKTCPVFTYKEPLMVNIKYKDILSSLNVKTSSGPKIIDSILIEKHKELNKKLNLCLSVGKTSFTNKSLSLYGRPNQKLVKKAEEILKEEYDVHPKKTLHNGEVIKGLRATFQEMNIKGWKIKKADMTTSASVIPSLRTFNLKKRERMPKIYLDRLKIHEIGVHVARYENGCLQPLNLFRFGFPNYLSTEEGLAMYAEEQTGVLSPKYKRNYAGRVLAVDSALKSSFSETYKYLCQFFSKQDALKLTIRAKRGLEDTSQPGGFTKDYLYLKGYYDVKKYAKKNDLKSLYYGKISIKYVNKIKELIKLNPPKYLPKFITDKESEN